MLRYTYDACLVCIWHYQYSVIRLRPWPSVAIACSQKVLSVSFTMHSVIMVYWISKCVHVAGAYSTKIHNGVGHLKIIPLALCPSQTPQTSLGMNPGFHSEIQLTNCLSHGMASLTHPRQPKKRGSVIKLVLLTFLICKAGSWIAQWLLLNASAEKVGKARLYGLLC